MKADPSRSGHLWTRRQFATSLAMATGAVSWTGIQPPASGEPTTEKPPPQSLKVALIATEIRKYSHAQHFVDRLLEGYGWQGRWHLPPFKLTALYVDQFPEGDLARERAARHKVPLYPSIAEALTLGASNLGVDGVLIIGEHGTYPKNELGQTLYPRHKWFKEVVKVFEASGRSVPVFNDKHLATNWADAAEMVADSKRLGFAFLAGSSLPVTWRVPEVEPPLNCPLTESVAVCYGGVDSYDFHGLETAQCMSERRAGGEVGVKSIHAVKGAAVFDLLAKRDATVDLVLAALSRSHTLTPGAGYTYAIPTLESLRLGSPDTVAYFIEHLDGFKTTMLLLNGGTPAVAGLSQKSRDALFSGRAVRDFTYAGRMTHGEVISCKMHLPMPPYYATLADFFNPLMNHVERTVLERKAPYPIERTLLTTGMTALAVESLHRGAAVETPELKVAYQPSAESQFWRS